MDQSIWGPSMWFILHSVGFSYPINPTEEDKQEVYNFFKSLGHVLPCSVCRKHFKRNFEEIPIKLNNREDLSTWLVDVHNEINGRTGKKTMTLEQVKKLYEQQYQMKIPLNNNELKLYKNTNQNIFSKSVCLVNSTDYYLLYLLIIIFLLTLIIYFLYNK